MSSWPPVFHQDVVDKVDSLAPVALASGFRAYASGSTTVGIATYTKVALATEIFDRGNEFSTVNSRFTANATGTYLFSAALGISGGGANMTHLALFINGGTSSYKLNAVSATYALQIGGSVYAPLTAGDYVELMVYSTSSAATYDTGDYLTWLAGVRIT